MQSGRASLAVLNADLRFASQRMSGESAVTMIRRVEGTLTDLDMGGSVWDGGGVAKS